MRRVIRLPSVFSALLVLGWVACSSSGSGVSQKRDASADIRVGSGGATGKGGALGSGGLSGTVGGSGGAVSTGGGAGGLGGVTGDGGGPSRDGGGISLPDVLSLPDRFALPDVNLQLPDGFSLPDLPSFNPDAFTLPDLRALFGEAGVGGPCAASVVTGADCQTGTDTICTPEGGTLCICGFGDSWTCF